MLRTFITLIFFATPTFLEASPHEKLVVGALGDSISTGFNARRLGDNREFSWSTGNGSGLNSQSVRIAKKRNIPVVSYNEAIAGSTINDLQRQVNRLLRHTPDYVTITIGANDICQWDSDYSQNQLEFREKLTQVIRKLVSHNSNVKIIMIPIPNLYHLWEMSHKISGCQEIWDTMKMCQPLLDKSLTIDERLTFMERWEIANNIIAEMAYYFPDQIRFQPELANFRFEWHHLSPKDCFHPSIAGQNLMADFAWKAILESD